MTPELKQKWVAALRSGKFKQNRKCILRGGKLCCLGVLLAVAGDPPKEGVASPNRNAKVLTNKGLDFTGLREHQQQDAVCWNDHHLMSFAEIADKIECCF